MKFYRDKEAGVYFSKIKDNKFSAIYSNSEFFQFFKNGKYHNNKNAANICNISYKDFYLNGVIYGTENDFTKKSWRKFVKLGAFL